MGSGVFVYAQLERKSRTPKVITTHKIVFIFTPFWAGFLTEGVKHNDTKKNV